MAGGSRDEPEGLRKAFCGRRWWAGRRLRSEQTGVQYGRPHAEAMRDVKEQIIVIDSMREERAIALRRP